MTPSGEVLSLADRFRLAIPVVTGTGRDGDQLGRGTGASLEFQDRRSYVAGDDLRHLDWRAYARTDQLMLRLYREEILPHVEIVVDTSRSMATSEDKESRTTDLVALIAEVARASGFSARVWCVADQAVPLDRDHLQQEGIEYSGALPLTEGLRLVAASLKPGSLRVLVSDFLFPHSAREMVRPLAARAGAFVLLQVLSADDVEPEVGSALRLTDSESGETLDLVLEPRVVGEYKARVHRLATALHEECRRSGGRWLSLDARRTLAELCREELVAGEVLAPR